MRIAIVHYHLAPGGVTRVIEAAAQALTAAGIEYLVLSSSPPLQPHTVQVPALSYMNVPGYHTVDSIIQDLSQAVMTSFGTMPDVWHFHNHSLGKNLLFAGVIARLAEMGERLVLQIHDLAEDGRPDNYRNIANCQQLYPIGPRVHYTFINSRDHELFTQAGLPMENSSLLLNPITPKPLSRSTRGPALVFAPIRAIRRKNIGELVLLSALAPPTTRFAIARAPLNPRALPIYENWRRFADQHHLPLEFGVVDRLSPQPGASSDFESWVAHCSHFVSTSVAEGFGMPFLECIAYGKPLFGRDIPHLTKAYPWNPYLYEAIPVPLGWIDLEGQPSKLPLHLIHSGKVDFGNLPEPLQEVVIEKFLELDKRDVPLVKWLENAIGQRQPHASTSALEAYSLTAYQNITEAIYHQLIAQPESPIGYLDHTKVLNAYLQPEHFLLSALPPVYHFRAVIFDIYGTLLIAPAGGVKPDFAMDPLISGIIRDHGHQPPVSPSTVLYDAVLAHHARAGVAFPEIDLGGLWKEVLALDEDPESLVHAIESVWHPAKLMPGAARLIENLSGAGISLGLLSNAQCNALDALGPLTNFFAPELTILSYQHGIAKPSPELFQMMKERLIGQGIMPEETLFIGNDPQQDIVPAAAVGFKTALFIGHPDSLRAGDCLPDYTFDSLMI